MSKLIGLDNNLNKAFLFGRQSDCFDVFLHFKFQKNKKYEKN
ncbi:MAG: hypothetical protein H6Q25_986 [Bacteroidetes bacterium]|nr:hypothetical protein [Bacteroidota bacterium]